MLDPWHVLSRAVSVASEGGIFVQLKPFSQTSFWGKEMGML